VKNTCVSHTSITALPLRHNYSLDLPIMKHSPKESARTPAKPLPSGQERMKRKAPTDLSLRPQKFEFDPKKAYTAEQLAEIGAITLKWNQIEAHIDFIGSHILFSKTPFWLQIGDEQSPKLESQTSSPERVPQTLDPHGR
jgi:hypothetical protein